MSGRTLLSAWANAGSHASNGFSKKLDDHVAAVALYVCHYYLCRAHEALRTTPAKALGVVDRSWSISRAARCDPARSAAEVRSN
jgi:hypothetical protein